MALLLTWPVLPREPASKQASRQAAKTPLAGANAANSGQIGANLTRISMALETGSAPWPTSEPN